MNRAILSNIAFNLQRIIREAGLRVVDQSLYDVNGRTCLQKKKENQRKKAKGDKKKRKNNMTRGGRINNRYRGGKEEGGWG